MAATSTPWWRHAVFYQVYVRSFADGDGDGSGDLAGLRSRLPYLAGLGVDATPPPRSLATTDPRGYLALLQAANGAAELLDRRTLGSFAWMVRPVGVPDPFSARRS